MMGESPFKLKITDDLTARPDLKPPEFSNLIEIF